MFFLSYNIAAETKQFFVKEYPIETTQCGITRLNIYIETNWCSNLSIKILLNLRIQCKRIFLYKNKMLLYAVINIQI